ncbi:phenylacetate--CoA ligase family protein [Rhodoferax lacus]|nr:phenylacetate--CoA ligase family protein [Rhodoferax lacus]
MDCFLLGAAALDVLAANRCSRRELALRQAQRLDRLLRELALGNTLYAAHLRGRGHGITSLQQLPVVTKAELMQRFDEWVTDPQLRLPDLQAFTADPTRIAEPFLGQYTVWESSGSSGTPGIFVQDRCAMAIYDALESIRRSPPCVSRRWLDPLYCSERMALVAATEGHFASIVSVRRLKHINPWAAQATHCLSILQPLNSLVQQLNAFAPTILSTYPTVATLLAEQQALGKLKLKLSEVWTGGETLSGAARERIAEVFQCAVRNHYGASEFFSIASECARGQMHANTDWLILEPVDENHQPVPPGHASATTLLTHLGNRVQPLVRYDLGDQITLVHSPCACGSPFPVIQVSGRNDPPLRLRGRQGVPVVIVPLALTTVLEEQAGLFAFQLRQQDDATLELAVPQKDAHAQASLRKACRALQRFFDMQGAARIRIHTRSGVELPRGTSGKAARVLSI